MAYLTSRPALCAFLFSLMACLFLAITSISNRPLFPIDETRYLTVAWEMFSHQEWILPTLNFEPYSHKPPLLFWLIMSVWSITGVSQQAAMIVPFGIVFATCTAMIRMVRVMVPENKSLPLVALLLFAGSLPFAIYGQLIMFDMLLTLFVILGITSIWQFGRTGHLLHVLMLGLCIGLGLLAKGPVIFLHLIFPLLLAPLWLSKDVRKVSWGKWVGGLLLALFIGAGIGLAWAIPAAIKGGPEFTEKIFWGQTAGRMSNSFDHNHPVWWYLPFVVLFMMPWVFHAGLWKGLKNLGTASISLREPLKFLGCWLIPVFISFSLISGKQIHYLLPLLPGILLLFALAFERMQSLVTPLQALASFIFCLVLTLAPAALMILSHLIPPDVFDKRFHLQGMIDTLSLSVSLGAGVIILLIGGLTMRRPVEGQLAGISLAMLITLGSLQLQAKDSFYKSYDLAPIASAINTLPTATPLAFVRNYHGEWGFLARLKRPVTQIDIHELKGWFEKHPKGAAFIRTRDEGEYAGYDVVYKQPYKMGHLYAVIMAPGQASLTVKSKHPLQ